MALHCRLFEQCQGTRWIAGPAGAGQHHLAERYLSVRHAGLGRARDPSAPFRKIAVHASSLDKRAAIPELRVRDPVGCLAQPQGRLSVVAYHANTKRQADGTIVRGHRITRCRRLLEPLVDEDTIVLFPHAGEEEISELGARRPVPGSSGDAEPLHALLGIVRDAGTGEIEQAKRARRALVASLGCAAEPTCCFRMIWRQASGARMEIA